MFLLIIFGMCKLCYKLKNFCKSQDILETVNYGTMHRTDGSGIVPFFYFSIQLQISLEIFVMIFQRISVTVCAITLAVDLSKFCIKKNNIM